MLSSLTLATFAPKTATSAILAKSLVPVVASSKESNFVSITVLESRVGPAISDFVLLLKENSDGALPLEFGCLTALTEIKVPLGPGRK